MGPQEDTEERLPETFERKHTADQAALSSANQHGRPAGISNGTWPKTPTQWPLLPAPLPRSPWPSKPPPPTLSSRQWPQHGPAEGATQEQQLLPGPAQPNSGCPWGPLPPNVASPGHSSATLSTSSCLIPAFCPQQPMLPSLKNSSELPALTVLSDPQGLWLSVLSYLRPQRGRLLRAPRTAPA